MDTSQDRKKYRNTLEPSENRAEDTENALEGMLLSDREDQAVVDKRMGALEEANRPNVREEAAVSWRRARMADILDEVQGKKFGVGLGVSTLFQIGKIT